MKLILSRGDKIVVKTEHGATIVVTAEESTNGDLILTASKGRKSTTYFKVDSLGTLTVHD